MYVVMLLSAQSTCINYNISFVGEARPEMLLIEVDMVHEGHLVRTSTHLVASINHFNSGSSRTPITEVHQRETSEMTCISERQVNRRASVRLVS